MSTPSAAKETEYTYSFDPVGGAPRDVETKIVTYSNTPKDVLYDQTSTLPRVVVSKIERRDGSLIAVGEKQIPSGTVQIEVIQLNGKCTHITLFPHYTERFLKLISGFNQSAREQVEKLIQTPALARIQLYQNQLLFGLVHKTTDIVYWYETPKSEYEGAPDGIDFLSTQRESHKVVEMLLLSLKSGKKNYSLVSGIHVLKPVNKVLERELLDLPSSKYTWEELSKYIEPFLEMRCVDQFANLSVY